MTTKLVLALAIVVAAFAAMSLSNISLERLNTQLGKNRFVHLRNSIDSDKVQINDSSEHKDIDQRAQK
jgi:hypothetical protein